MIKSITRISFEYNDVFFITVSPQNSLIHSAAGIAAAAAAMHSSAAISSGSQNTSSTLGLEPKVKITKETVRTAASPEKIEHSKDSPSYTQPDSSSNVVSSTMDENEVNDDSEEPESSKFNEVKSRRVKSKVFLIFHRSQYVKEYLKRNKHNVL